MDKIRVGAAALVFSEGKLLLARRNKEPNKGMYILPGGGVDFGESLEKAVRRELLEETSLELTDLKPFRHFELIDEGQHRIIFYFFAKAMNPDCLKSSDDVYAAKFFSQEEIDALGAEISPFVREVLESAVSNEQYLVSFARK